MDPTMTTRKNTGFGRRETTRARLRGRLKGLVGGGIGFAALAAILLFAAPFSSAAGVLTITAPYTGFTSSASTYSYHSHCASATNSTPLSWNATTGVGLFNGVARSGGCPGSLYAASDGYGSVVSRLFHTPTPGVGYVYLTFSSAFSAHAALHIAPGGNASNGTYHGGSAAVELYVLAEVIDETHHNGTLFGYSYLYLVDQAFYGTSGTFSLTQGATSSYLYITGTFTAGHIYQLYLDVVAYVSADTYGGGSTAVASLDAASGSNGVTLSSITAY
jgi:hypothetical protein